MASGEDRIMTLPASNLFSYYVFFEHAAWRRQVFCFDELERPSLFGLKYYAVYERCTASSAFAPGVPEGQT